MLNYLNEPNQFSFLMEKIKILMKMIKAQDNYKVQIKNDLRSLPHPYLKISFRWLSIKELLHKISGNIN